MRTPSHLEREYELKGQDAQQWLEQAKKLKLSADVIRGKLEEIIKQNIVRPSAYSEAYRIGLLSYIESFMMLTGMAFENLIKGIDIAADASLIADGKLDTSRWKVRGGHDLSNWARNAKLSLDKINLLVRLEEFSVWAGRYPIPTNSNTYIRSKLPDNKQSLSYPDDFKLIDELFEELAEQLAAVWSVNGALR